MHKTTLGAGLVATALLAAMPAAAQTQTATRFIADFGSAATPGEEMVAERNQPLLTFRMTPELAVELVDEPDEDLQEDLGASGEFPLAAGTLLFGSSNRPSLYCHLINDRLVGSSGTCFRDFDSDGAFEQGVKLEAPGLETDVVLPDHTGRLFGGEFVDRVRLRPPLAYRAVTSRDNLPSYEATLTWEASVRRVDPEDYPVGIRFHMTAREEQGQVTVGAECYADRMYDGSPVTLTYYGNEITVLGFNEEGHMRYTITPSPEPVTVGFVYRFVTGSAYVAIALARNANQLSCGDPTA